jgi:thiamine-phosphate pyrophosphorylase
MSSSARILDANANRAREAMRVMEDAARFAINDQSLCGGLKEMRHELRAALDALPAGWLEANRDTPGDVGTHISTSAEMERATLLDVVIAAGKRLGESLRVMEEIAKTIDPATASHLESLRYRAYAVEALLHQRLGSGRGRQWRMCVLLTESLCRRSWREVLQAVLDGGADCIQVREKDIPGGLLVQRVREVIEVARPRGVSVIVNDRADVAIASGADGVHLGADDLSTADVRRMAGRTLLIGASTHDLNEAKAAIEAGADYCGVGTMFASTVKPDRPIVGTAYLRQFIERYPNVPHLAIGGITTENVHELIDAGAGGVAVSAAVCAADDPAAVVRMVREATTGVSKVASIR